MKRTLIIGAVLCVMVLIAALSLVSCRTRELYIGNGQAGLNGSFEVAAPDSPDYPVCWAMFPSPEGSKVTSVSLDSTVVQDGKHSLKLVADEINGSTGVRSRRISIESGKRYKISFWIINKEGAFYVNRVIRDRSGKKNIRANIIARSATHSDAWQQFEEEILVAEDEKYLHLIFMMLKPGTLLIDNVKIEEIPSK